MEEPRLVDFRKIEEKCNLPKLEAIQTYILNHARPGELLEIIVRDPDTWYAIKNLGDQLGYTVIEDKQEDDHYTIIIRVE